VDDAPPQVSIVVPCRDEAAVLPRLLAALDDSVAELAARGSPAEVIVVDDGSSDGSWATLRAAAPERPWLRAVRLRRGYGQTTAMAAGFERARGAVIVPMDADLQNDPADIPALLDRLDDGYDLVSGWRRRRRDHVVTRRLPSRAANWLIGRVTGLRLHDYGCTLKAYRREVLAPIRLYGEMHRFLPLYARAAGARICELEVRHHPRREGRSKHRLGRTPKVLLDLLLARLLLKYTTRPLHFFGAAGLLLGLLGLLTAAAVLAVDLAAGPFTGDLALLLGAGITGLAGLQLVGLGLLAELQVRTHREASGQPTYLVGEEIGAGTDRGDPP